MKSMWRRGGRTVLFPLMMAMAWLPGCGLLCMLSGEECCIEEGQCCLSDLSCCNGLVCGDGHRCVADPCDMSDLAGNMDYMPNPASIYCGRIGGETRTDTDAEGNQYGICVLPNGTEMGQWELFCTDCPDHNFCGNGY